MPDPSILVTLHSLDDASLAPPGCSTLYVLEPVPNLDGRVDWTTRRDGAVDRLRRQVAAAGYPTDVVTEEIYDPLDWEAMGMERGTPFALAHTFRQTGPFRPRNVDRRVPGLVFVGSSTVPGVGVPMVLVSGKLAAARVRRLGGRSVTVTLEASYAECRRLNKRHGTTYYWSTMVLPAVKRPHVHALYAFCRYADDIVDDVRRRRPSSAGPPRSPTSAIGSSPTSIAGAPTTSSSRPWSTRSAPSTSIGRLRPLPAVDGDGPHDRALRDLGGPARATWTARRP